ncbi:MAG TPA: ribonuclease P protein component, partial [Mariniflexile sp.]
GLNLLRDQFMLSQVNRLPSSEFDKVKSHGKLYQGKFFGISALNRNDNKPSRFGFIISAKISRKAVDRNKIKRLMTKAIRNVVVRIAGGNDIIFLAKRILNTGSETEVVEETHNSLRKVGLLK